MNKTKYVKLMILLALSISLNSQAYDKATLKIIEEAANKAAKKATKEALEALEALEKNQLRLEKITKPKSNKATNKMADKMADKVQKDNILTNSRLMSIGTGAVGGNYFVLGELVGGIISHPHGSLPCGSGGTCGVKNLQTLNITSAGSMANLNYLSTGKVTSGFVQSDIAYWSYTGTGPFDGKNKMSDLRAIASLYPESIHIVAHKKVKSIADLKGKRVSIGARESGTLSQARLVLNAYSLTEDNMRAQYLNNQQSLAKMKKGELDAMFFSVGTPAPALTNFFEHNKNFKLLSINDSAQQKIISHGYYFSPNIIAKGTYLGVNEIQTVSVFALWLCSSKVDDKLVYQMTKALWSDTSRHLLDSGFIGKQVIIKNSLQGIGIPLHSGAKKYYNEIGKRY